jgi:hypothetical protein
MGAVIKELKLGANNLPPNARKKADPGKVGFEWG